MSSQVEYTFRSIRAACTSGSRQSSTSSLNLVFFGSLLWSLRLLTKCAWYLRDFLYIHRISSDPGTLKKARSNIKSWSHHLIHKHLSNNNPIRNRLPQKVPSHQRQASPRRVSVNVKPNSQLGSDRFGLVVGWLTVHQERIPMLCRAGGREGLVHCHGRRRLVGDAAGLGIGDFPVQEGDPDAGACCAVGLWDVRVHEEVAVFCCGGVFVGLGGEGKARGGEGFYG